MCFQRRIGMSDEFDGFVGWGEGIDSGCFEDERPDL